MSSEFTEMCKFMCKHDWMRFHAEHGSITLKAIVDWFCANKREEAVRIGIVSPGLEPAAR